MAKKTNSKPKKSSNGLMLAVIGAVVVLALIGAVWIWSASQNQSAPVAATEPTTAATSTLPTEISVEEAKKLMDDGAYLLDVREVSEWQEIHVPGAELIPLGELPNRLSEVPQDQQILVICRSGNRSQSGRDILLNAGYTNVTSVAGGVRAWQSAGLETVSGQ